MTASAATPWPSMALIAIAGRYANDFNDTIPHPAAR
jgi:hypothetical protein